MNVKAFIPLIAGLVVGVIALKLGADTLRKARGSQEKVQTVQVWAAAQDIERGQSVQESMITPIEFPAKLVPAGAFTEKEELVGRVAKVATFTGELFAEPALLPPGTRPGLPVPDGFRAVAVRIDEGSAVDYHIEPGSFVDVVAYFTVRGNGKQETIARTIIENVEVAAVGQKVSPNASASEEEEKAGGRRSRPARAVTLFVKPTQVPTLLLAEQRGKIKLSMRNSGDPIGNLTGTTTENDVLGMGSKPKTEPDGESDFNKQVKSLFGSWFGDKPQQPTAPVKEEAAPVAVTTPKPKPTQLAHKITIHQGNQVKQLGFTDLASMEPIELSNATSASRSPGQSAAQRLAAVRDYETGSAQPTQAGDATTDSDLPPDDVPADMTDAEDDTESEPEELE